MNGPLPVQPAAVAAALAARSTALLGQMPITDVAALATVAWQRGSIERARADQRRAAGTVAVVDAIYPLGFNAGRTASTAAVGAHITTEATQVATALDPADPGTATVRGLLDRLTTAAAEEVQRSTTASTRDRLLTPWPRSFVDAGRECVGHADSERVAHAASVAWNHGFEDGWTDGHWAANRIVNTVRHDERAATTMLAGTPTFVWLDDLAESARDISSDKPPGHPARLARLAGAEPAPGAQQPRSSPRAQAPDDTIDKRYGRPFGM